MNKRIRELYNQSLVVQNDDAQWIDDELDPEKFAQLIVRECVDYAFSDDYERQQMLKHFGVEE